MSRVIDIRGYGLSSPYGSRNALGHALKLKSIGIIEVITDNGITGLGETYAGVYAPEMIKPAIEFLKPFVIGKDVLDIDQIHHKLSQIPFLGRNGFLLSVSSAINIALWDILGKLSNQPVWKLLTKKSRKKVRLYASSGSSVFTPQEIISDVQKISEDGYTAYKMRVGYQNWSDDLSRVEAAFKKLNGADLMIDAIMGTLDPPWDTETAISKSFELDQFKPFWLEEPLHPNNLEGLKKMHGVSPIPIATGEALTGKFEFNQYLDSGALDYIQPDVTHSGGISAVVDIVQHAQKNKIKTALHVWGGAVAIAANAHLAIACEQIDILEMPMMQLDITKDMFLVPLNICDGYLNAPEEPGLGVRLTDEMKHKYKLVSGSGYRI